MKYVSIDIETTGLNPETDQVIEFAAIIEDTENYLTFEQVPKFQRFIKHEIISGSPFALALNKRILEALARGEGITEHRLPLEFKFFLRDEGFEPIKDRIEFTPAGKNFASFDRNFLMKIDQWSKHLQFFRRSIDPAILWWIPETDQQLPSTEECCKRANIELVNQHSALHDAWTVIQLVRKHRDWQE